MPDSNDQQPKSQPDKSQPGKSPERSLWGRLLGFDSWLHSAASLSIVTVIAGWFGTYIQYLNAYEQKVSATAQADMKDATAAFVEISDAYGEVQMLQQLIYYNYVAAAGTSDAGTRAMTTKAGQDAHQNYANARNALRKNTNIYVRKAELYIDWASNLDRDPAGTTANDGDPLTESLLGDYNFDCDASQSFPHYEAAVEYNENASQKACLAPNETQKQIAMGGEDRLLRRGRQRQDRSFAPLTGDQLAQREASFAGHALLLRADAWPDHDRADLGVGQRGQRSEEKRLPEKQRHLSKQPQSRSRPAGWFPEPRDVAA